MIENIEEVTFPIRQEGISEFQKQVKNYIHEENKKAKIVNLPLCMP